MITQMSSKNNLWKRTSCGGKRKIVPQDSKGSNGYNHLKKIVSKFFTRSTG